MKSIRRLAIVGLCAATAVGSQEVQVPCSIGQQPLCYGEFINCDISPAGDSDVYQFFGEAGDSVRLTVAGWTNNLDPVIRLYDPANGLFQPGGVLSCASGCCNACSFGNEFTLPLSGMYTLEVFDDDNFNTGSYFVNLDLLTPQGPQSTLDYGAFADVVLDHGFDHDWLEFEVTEGTGFRLNLTGLTNNLDPYVRIYQPDGTIYQNGGQSLTGCASGCCNACSYSILVQSAPQTGTYKLMIFDDDGFNFGTVRVALTCILGTCPPPDPNAPIGQTYCTSSTNTTGNVASLTAYGTRRIIDNDVYLVASDAPSGKFAIFFAGPAEDTTPSPLPFSEGVLCLLPPVTRLPVLFTCSDGTIHYQLDLTDPRIASLVAPAQATHFQAWFRDPTSSGQLFDTNTSDGLRIVFQ